MNERRVFLKVLGAGALASACNTEETAPATSSSDASTGSEATTSTGGVGGSASSSNGSTANTSSTASGVGGGGAGGGGGSGGGGLPENYAIVGKVSDIMLGLLKQAGQGLLLGRDAGGVYAMSALCTHNFCDMNPNGQVSPSGVRCTCHNSKFDNNGAVTQGPAIKALDHFDCAIDADGNVGVDKAKVVAVEFRALRR